MPHSARQLFTGFTPQPQRFAFIASARMQLKLHGIHEKVFPKPLQMATVHEGALPPGLPPHGINADMLCRVVLRPTKNAGNSHLHPRIQPSSSHPPSLSTRIPHPHPSPSPSSLNPTITIRT